MGSRFIIKHINSTKPQLKSYSSMASSGADNENKEKVNERVMTTSEKIEMAKNVLNDTEKSVSVKRVKKDKGLIERTESSKTILTEDNKELLND